jgi:DNA (cytosine-5)-methyltransferase 1
MRIDSESETFITHALRADGFDASEDGTGRGTPLVPVTVGVHCFDARQNAVIQYGDKTGPLDQNAFSQAIAFRTSGQEGFTPSEVSPPVASTDGGGAGVPTIAFSCKDHGADAGELSPTLRSMGHDGSHANAGGQVAVAFNLRGRDGGSQPEMSDVASVRAASGGSSRSYIAAMQVRRLTPVECERLQGMPDSWTAVTHRGKIAADGPRYKALGNSMAVPVLAWIGSRLLAEWPKTL